MKLLLNYGVWVTVTGIVGHLMVYGDRFFVSAAVGAVGPAYLDEKTGCYSKVIRFGRLFSKSINIRPNDDEPIQADFLIASGSLIRVSVFNKIGLMREDLFIDGVDVEGGVRNFRV
jgi:GT2 family glycosyltransferase